MDKKIVVFCLCFLITIFLTPSMIIAASFVCSKASTQVEKLICQDTEISKLDSKMSDVYEQALKKTKERNTLKVQQRQWLHNTRNSCSDISCLKSAYLERIEQLYLKNSWMTNEKEHAICEAVVNAVNDGSIAARIIPFEKASEDERSVWEDNRADSSILYLDKTLKINAYGRVITLGLVGGGGTCGNCDIEDIHSLVTAVYPPDDKEERFRWMGWGQCDHFLFVEGEPVIVTGNFQWGFSRASFVTWLAPDGAKRALCYLGPDKSKKTISKIISNKDSALCDAVVNNKIEEIPWSQSIRIPGEQRGWDSSRDLKLDINLDGKKETIVLFDHASGAGCGSYSQWLREFTKHQRTPFPEESKSNTETSLNKIFAMSGGGPIKNTGDRSIENTKENKEWHSIKLFRYAGKPYILGAGTETSAEVISVWENQKKIWCEYHVLPQHMIEVYYPVETWPSLNISEFKKTKGARALHNAAEKNDKEKVLRLIKSGTPVDVIDGSGQTPLGQAIMMGHIDMVKLLLDSGALINGVKSWRGSPLIQATRFRRVEIVEFLLLRKANPNIRSEPHPGVYGDKGSTALGFAIEADKSLRHNPESDDSKKNKRIIELLLKAGAKQ